MQAGEMRFAGSSANRQHAACSLLMRSLPAYGDGTIHQRRPKRSGSGRSRWQLGPPRSKRLWGSDATTHVHLDVPLHCPYLSPEN